MQIIDHVLVEVLPSDIVDRILTIPAGVKVIADRVCYGKYISKIIIPNTVTSIGDFAFAYNELTSIEIPESLINLGAFAFKGNQIKSVTIPKGIRELGDETFSFNEIKELTIPSNITKLGSGVFMGNMLDKITLEDGLMEIGPFAFQDNQLKEVSIPNSIKKIGNAAFGQNEIRTLHLGSHVETVGDGAFSKNKIEQVIIPDSVFSIGIDAFAKNQIRNVTLGKGLLKIGETAFQKNDITSLLIPGNVEEIDIGAFSGNEITNVTIVEGNLKKIQPFLFDNNPIQYMSIPANLASYSFITRNCCHQLDTLVIGGKEIQNINGISKMNFKEGKLMLLVDQSSQYLIIDPKTTITRIDVQKLSELLSNDLIEQHHDRMEFRPDLIMDWVKIYVSKAGNVNKDMLSKMSLEIMMNLPATRENANMIKQGIGNYNNFKARHELVLPNYDSFFKMCYALGMFDGDMKTIKENTQVLDDLFRNEVIYEERIHSVFKNFDLKNPYNKNASHIIVEALKQDIAHLLGIKRSPHVVKDADMKRVYNEFYAIKRHIEKAYKIDIRNINPKIKEILNPNMEKEQLEQLKREVEIRVNSMSTLGLREVEYYLNNNIFLIREGNEELSSITSQLKGISQETFDKIQDLYEASKGRKKELIQTIDSGHDYIYQWSASDNPTNLVLSEHVHCCARMDGPGEDIMVQSMLNPFVQNLIIRDKNLNIVAKTTAFYNKEKNYILFNNVEAPKTVKGFQEEEKNMIKDAIKRAAYDQAMALSILKDTDVEIRIGMRTDIFLEHDLPVFKGKENLLVNYPYYGYEGDASDPEYGQGILYSPAWNIHLEEKEEKKR